MKILDNGPAYSAVRAAEKTTQGSAYDDTEKKVLVRFEKGVDFDTFDDFQAAFVGLLNEESKEWGRRQVRRMETLGLRQQIAHLKANVQGWDVGIPEHVLDQSTLREKVGKHNSP